MPPPGQCEHQRDSQHVGVQVGKRSAGRRHLAALGAADRQDTQIVLTGPPLFSLPSRNGDFEKWR